ncbi:MAG: ABC transporter permease [Actinobacteria bacterium]|nr:ABC transporter permease [Actinomycetota bacterium]
MSNTDLNVNRKSGWQRINIFKVNSIAPSLVIVFILMCAIFGGINPQFLSFVNFKTIISGLSVYGMMAVGLSFVVLTGNFDVSVGSVVGICSIVMAMMFNIEGVKIPIAVIILAGIALGAFVGAINGFLITVVGINSVITTLGTLAILRGVALLLANKPALINDKFYVSLGRGFIAKTIPYSFVYLIVIFVIAYLLLRFTKFGRNVYQVGSNSNAARLAGIPVKRTQFLTFVVAGITCGISAFLMTSQAAFAQGEFGTGFEFTILTIVVLGGISLAGGRGTLIGVAAGLLIINSIANGLTMIDVPVFWREAFNGIILIAAILIDSIRVRRRELLKA